MSKRDHSLLLEDMYESAVKIKKYTEGQDFDSFMEDDKTIDADKANYTLVFGRN
jgi:uncharacterized protein with HEPN domain